jgi:phage-related holin
VGLDKELKVWNISANPKLVYKCTLNTVPTQIMYCLRNEMICILEDKFTMGIIPLKLSDVLKQDQSLDNIEMASVDIDDI